MQFKWLGDIYLKKKHLLHCVNNIQKMNANWLSWYLNCCNFTNEICWFATEKMFFCRKITIKTYLFCGKFSESHINILICFDVDKLRRKIWTDLIKILSRTRLMTTITLSNDETAKSDFYLSKYVIKQFVSMQLCFHS